MGFEKTLQLLETYSREYLLYLLAFFRPRAAVGPATDIETPEGKIVVYAMLSAAIGLFLSYRFVSSQVLDAQAFATEICIKFAYWLTIALFLHAVLKMSGARIAFMGSLIAVLTVMPVAYAIGGYSAYVIHHVARLWTAQVFAATYFTAVFAQLGIAVLFLPRVLSREPLLNRWHVALGTGSVTLLLFAVQFLALFVKFSPKVGS